MTPPDQTVAPDGSIAASGSAGAPAPLALTMGEPAGIGGEITLAAWLACASLTNGLTFVAIDDPDRLRALAGQLGWTVPVEPVADPGEAPAVFARALPVLPLDTRVDATLGQPKAETAGAVTASIARAVALTTAGACSAIVTNPIHKKVLYDTGFAHPGHTEYLADLAGGDVTPVMMLAIDGLRVVPATVHIPLHAVPGQVTTERLVETGTIVLDALARDFGFAYPRLAVAGLNPHAGEDGTLGTEDRDIIAPAIARLAEHPDATVTGPIPADSLFHARARAGYDAALCMYHDQALIPLKAIDFDNGVNITLGLPFVRTSPDHGTALDIAGRGLARPDSLIAALKTAWQMAAARAR